MFNTETETRARNQISWEPSASAFEVKHEKELIKGKWVQIEDDSYCLHARSNGNGTKMFL